MTAGHFLCAGLRPARLLHRRQEHGTQRSIRGTGGCGKRRGDGGDHLYAKANLYGMGAGVFPKDKVPRLPAHPHCMCFLKPVIRGMIDNEMPIDRVEEVSWSSKIVTLVSHKLTMRISPETA